MRYTLTKRLSETPGFVVVGAARDGNEALSLIPKVNPHVITLDVEMPRLNGLATLREIMRRFPRPVVMLSSLTIEGANETIQALNYGAVDFIAKPGAKANIDAVMDEVVAKLLRAAKARVHVTPLQEYRPPTLPAQKTPQSARPFLPQDPLVIIGASTGGPRALNQLIPQLPGDLQAAFLVVQHMPAGFTHTLAERLNQTSELIVKEAEPGDRLQVGQVLVAPGGFHTLFDDAGRVVLNQSPPMHGVRPALDVTISSAAQYRLLPTAVVILTGMGCDGLQGAKLIHTAGGIVLAEDESSCVVWGMPRSVIEAGAADIVAPLDKMAAKIVDVVKDMKWKRNNIFRSSAR